MKKYTQFTLTTIPKNNELISGLLWQFDFAGIVESETGLVLYVEQTKPISEIEISSLLDSAKDEGLLTDYYIKKETIEDKNWNEEYERNVKVIEVNEKIVIKPSFKEYNSKEGQIVITIDPKMSFGTGEHETTKLVLQMIEKYIRPNDFVLDVGSGTGILSIAAAYLGAKKVIGIDNDEWCIINGRENISMNSLHQKVEVRLGEIHSVYESEFDLIVANINKHILLDIATNLKGKLKKTGSLILSGLLYSDEKEIVKCYVNHNFKLEEKIQLGDWIALSFRLNN